MQIVINIPEEVLNSIKTFKGKFICENGYDLIQGIKNGISLPKGHGDLIDRNELISDAVWDDREEDFIAVSCNQIEDAEVIVKADEVTE